MIAQVNPVIDISVRDLCRRPYHGHPKGCPNYGKKPGCPPGAPLFDQVYDLEQPVYAMYNAFPIGRHASEMRRRAAEKGKQLTDYQAYNCLYWQQTARKQLTKMIEVFLFEHPDYTVDDIEKPRPEAGGVNITATMAGIGVELKWPPRIVAYQVALAGVPR